ncbi:MAG: hypothetical protein U0T74_06260 [Chitinophagales bacterium]
MKTRYYLSVLLFASGALSAEVSYTLPQAIQKKLVTVQIKGAKPDTSFHGAHASHYGPCMAMEIYTTGAEVLKLNLEYGYKLEPADTNLQTMMVTQSLIVKLPPKQRRTYRIYAMCTQAHDGGPSPEASFIMGKRTTGNLLGLAELINRKKYQNDAAQDAVWCLTDNYDVQTIFSEDTAMMYELRRFVAKAKGLLPEKIYEERSLDVYDPVRTITTRTVYSGSLSYSCSKTSKVMIALFDEDNKMKRVYVNNETQREGTYTYNYQIGSDEMEQKKHYLRMFRDGKLEEEISILPHD